ncbi:hypothetical protein AN958_08163 [Leucoagaricus sp. SymC.cos]|nr:hypothetical protein AN958_08163 [Leucoagaricus sp. SymC.cos]
MSHLSSTSTTSFLQPTDSSNGNPNGPNTSPTGSPPLILAFLAIGIFSAAMIAVFGWRRVQLGRSDNLWRYGGSIGSDARRATRDSDSAGSADRTTGEKLGKRPVMWEAWADRSCKVGGGDYGGWETTTVRCSSPNSLSPEPPPVFLPPPTDSSPRSSRRRQRLDDITPLSIFRRHYSAHNTSPTVPLSGGQAQPVEKNLNDEMEGGRDVQVFVIIEMPSPTSSRYRHAYILGHHKSPSLYSSFSKSETLVDNSGRLREDLLGIDRDAGQFQYCIGVYTCPWPRTSTSSPTINNESKRIPQSQAEKELA